MRNKKPVDERANIRIPVEYREKLNHVCKYRGWTQAEFARRCLDREFFQIEHERSTQAQITSS